jgi:hypothetical protein
MQHWQAPHHRQRNDCALQRVRVDIGHLRRSGTFEENDRPMRISSKGSGLLEESTVRERHRQIGVRLPLDHDAVVDAIVTDIEVVHSYVEGWTLLRKGEQSRCPFGKVDAENVPSCRHVCSVRIFTFESQFFSLNRQPQSLDRVGLTFSSHALPLCATPEIRRCHRQPDPINRQDLQPFKTQRVQFPKCVDRLSSTAFRILMTWRTGQSRPTSLPMTLPTNPPRAAGSSNRARMRARTASRMPALAAAVNRLSSSPFCSHGLHSPPLVAPQDVVLHQHSDPTESSGGRRPYHLKRGQRCTAPGPCSPPNRRCGPACGRGSESSRLQEIVARRRRTF